MGSNPTDPKCRFCCSMVIAITIRICAKLSGINKYSRTALTRAYGDDKTQTFNTRLKEIEGSSN